MQFYVLDEHGVIVNSVWSTSRERVQGIFPGYEIKSEDELSLQQLQSYSYWNRRP
jgi:hypothetical protein